MVGSMVRVLVCLLVTAWLTATAAAQPQEPIKFLLTVEDTGNQNGVIEPGEAALFTVTADMKADGINSVGTPVFWNQGWVWGTLYALGSAQFDLISLAYGHTGTWSQMAVTPSLYAGGNFQGTPQPDGSVYQVGASQLVILPHMPGDQRDPIPLWTALWTPSDYAPRDVAYTTIADYSEVYVDVPSAGLVGESFYPIQGSVVFTIIPSSSGCAVLVLAACLSHARRRRAVE